jgi:hypothetical protein
MEHTVLEIATMYGTYGKSRRRATPCHQLPSLFIMSQISQLPDWQTSQDARDIDTKMVSLWCLVG